jgi:hypothetical protein
MPRLWQRRAPQYPIVMAALVAAIHVFLGGKQGVDGRHKAGHDVERLCA